MFTLRTEQMAQINELRESEYHEKLADYFRSRVPDLVKRLDEAELRATIAEAAGKAPGYGIRSADGIVRFVGLALAAGPKFDEDAQIQQFLTLEVPEGEAKVEFLVRRIAEKLREV